MMSWSRIHPRTELILKYHSHQVLAHDANPGTRLAGYQAARLHKHWQDFSFSFHCVYLRHKTPCLSACSGILEMWRRELSLPWLSFLSHLLSAPCSAQGVLTCCWAGSSSDRVQHQWIGRFPLPSPLSAQTREC